MSSESTPAGGNERELILFVVGDSPRSRRARANLDSAIEDADIGGIRPREIDLAQAPREAVTHGLFASPALLRRDDRNPPAILYGDLSNRDSLLRFLAGFSDTDSASPAS